METTLPTKQLLMKVAKKLTRTVLALNAKRDTGHTSMVIILDVPRLAQLICIHPSRTDGVWNATPSGKAVALTKTQAVKITAMVSATGRTTGRTLPVKTNAQMDTLDVKDGATSAPTIAMIAMDSTPATSVLTTSD